MSTDTVLDLQNVKFGYDKSDVLIHINDLKISRGESVFLRGPSGSGKSTLLGLIGGVLRPQAGQISICGTEITALSAGRRDKIRAEHLGIIFQQLNLLPYLNILQNVTLPCRFSSARADRAASRGGSAVETARQLIKDLGLDANLLSRKVGNLSIGQQQRVAVARALLFVSHDLSLANHFDRAIDLNTLNKAAAA